MSNVTVVKKNGQREPFTVQKIKSMLGWASQGLEVNPLALEASMTMNIRDGVTTDYIHKMSIITAGNMVSIEEPDWKYVQGRLFMMERWKEVERRRNFGYDPESDNPDYCPLMIHITDYQSKRLSDNSEETYYRQDILTGYTDEEILELNNYIVPERDFMYDYAGAKMLVDRYLLPNELLQEVYMIIAMLLAKEIIKGRDDLDLMYATKKVYDLLSLMKISLATPLLLNLRKMNGNLASCYILRFADNIHSLFDNIKNIALIAKNAGGVAIDMSKVRAEGSWIKHIKGASSGIVPAIKVLNDVSIWIDQLGARSGAVSPACPTWHLDLLSYLDVQTETGEIRKKSHDVFLQIMADDLFMASLEDKGYYYLFDPYEVRTKLDIELADLSGDEFAKGYLKAVEEAEKGTLELVLKIKSSEIFKAILKSLAINGVPYWFFTDNVNAVNPAKKVGKIPCGNLCVTGDTKILTKKYGYISIEEVAGTTQECWNGYKWSKTKLFRTDDGSGQKVITVKLSNGRTIRATDYHRWKVQTKYNKTHKAGKALINNKYVEIVRTKDLRVGDKLVKFELPVMDEGTKKLKYAYENGLYTAEGYEGKYSKYIYLYDKKKRLINGLKGHKSIYFDSPREQERVKVTYRPDTLREKFFVPDASYRLKDRLNWLAGLIDGDGYVEDYIQICSINKPFLEDVQDMLQTLGVQSKIKMNMDAEVREFQLNDGSGEKKWYHCKATYLLMITGVDKERLIEMGLRFRRHSNKLKGHNRSAEKFVKVVAIDAEDGTKVPTYCGYEPENNTLMFNGVLTMNCIESYSVVVEDELAHTCNLVSIVSPRVEDEEFEEVMGWAVRILDASIELGTPAIEESVRHNEYFRTLGIGYVGFDDYRVSKGFTYQDLDKVSEYFERGALYALKESVDLAKHKGTFKMYEKSTWAEGQIYSRDLDWYKENAQHYDEWVKAYDDIQKYGVRNLQLFAIAPNTSTALLQGVTASIFPTHSKIFIEANSSGNLVKTPFYIKQYADRYIEYKKYDLLEMNSFVATVQKWIDSGISYEVTLDLNKLTAPQLRDFYIDAWKKGVKAIYYTRFITKDTKRKSKRASKSFKVAGTKQEPETKTSSTKNGYKISCFGCEN